MGKTVNVRTTFYVDGVRNVVEGFRNFKSYSTARLSKLGTETSERALRTAELLVPVDTGKLKESLHIEPMRKRGWSGKVVSSEEPYGVFVEFGVWKRLGQVKTLEKKPKPQPFIEPAYRNETGPFYAEAQKIMFEDAPREAWQTGGFASNVRPRFVRRA